MFVTCLDAKRCRVGKFWLLDASFSPQWRGKNENKKKKKKKGEIRSIRSRYGEILNAAILLLSEPPQEVQNIMSSPLFFY